MRVQMLGLAGVSLESRSQPSAQAATASIALTSKETRAIATAFCLSRPVSIRHVYGSPRLPYDRGYVTIPHGKLNPKIVPICL